jgi:bis(5'-nucleosidyl)-tetraphosphatase
MIDESWYQRPEGLPESVSAGGVVVRVEGEHILVAAVGEGKLNQPVLPKGHVEEGESIEDAARREIAEEAGLTQLTLLGELGMRERMSFDRREWKMTHYFLFITDEMDGRPTDMHHHYTMAWLALDQPMRLFWPEQEELIESNRERIRELAAQRGAR